MLDWYMGLPWLLRLAAALVFLLISTVLYFVGRFWPWGWGAGAVLLLFSFPNDAERKGYHDFR
jgi:hypothetical protein